jgi:hypothetical protein
MKYSNTIAERCKAHYESSDFEGNYFECLSESFGNNEGDIINRIIDLFNVSNYETEKALSNHLVINREQAKKIYDFIWDNLESFSSRFNGYYVGYTSLESVEFSEQEEQLTGLYNHKTGKEYNVIYLRKVFNEAGYCINDSDKNNAYYIVSGGLHIDLLNNVKDLNEFIATI